MEYKFSIKKSNPIAVAIVNNFSNIESQWARQICINITDHFVQRSIKYNYDVFIGNNENTLLKQISSDKFYSHICIVHCGVSLKINDNLFDEIEKLCKNDFFIAGHILERGEDSYWKNGYYELHKQFYIINCEYYRSMRKPFIGDFSKESHEQIEPNRSKEFLYGNKEIPKSILPGNKKNKKMYRFKCHGWNIISKALSNNLKMIDVGEGIRSSKLYLKYEYDHVFVREMRKVYNLQLAANNFVSAYNSDNLNSVNSSMENIQQFVVPSMGLNWIYYLKNLNFDNNCKVIFVDRNINALNFMENLILNWDGKDYDKFFKKFIPKFVTNINFDADAYIKTVTDFWENFIKNFLDFEDFWQNQIKKLKFSFVFIDFTADYNLSWLDNDKNTLIYLSDIFTHNTYVATQSYKHRIAAENFLIKKLQEFNPNIELIMTAHAADSFLKKQITKQGKVSDFTFTDINYLKTPDWHIKDWKSKTILF